MFVPNFQILGQVVSEKSLTEKKYTQNANTNTVTKKNTHKKKKKKKKKNEKKKKKKKKLYAVKAN